jgi:hypothetical protein
MASRSARFEPVFDHAGNPLNGLVEGYVFPDADHRPASSGKGGVSLPIAFDVAPQLGSPVPVVGRRFAAMFRAHMPEAPVDEDGDLLGGEDYVGTDLRTVAEPEEQILAVTIPLPVKCAAQRDFRLGVRAPVRAHVPRTPFIEGRRVNALRVSFCAARATVLARHGRPVCRIDTQVPQDTSGPYASEDQQ